MNLYLIVIFFFFLYFFLIAVLSSVSPRYLSARKLYLFRCLFPSWKFYEDLCFVPVLYYRISLGQNEFGDWEEGVEKLERKLRYLFINPKGNLNHAINSLLQQLENDKEDIQDQQSQELVDSVSYQLVQNLVLWRIKKEHPELDSFSYQFKLSSVMQGGGMVTEDILISLKHDYR